MREGEEGGGGGRTEGSGREEGVLRGEEWRRSCTGVGKRREKRGRSFSVGRETDVFKMLLCTRLWCLTVL